MAEQEHLFPDLPSDIEPVVTVKRLSRPVWTEHKAKIIARYLRYFVFITRHGNYIDGFAGPQRERQEGAETMWAARLVMQNQPRWLRKFFLYDIEPDQVSVLDELVAEDQQIDLELRSKGDRPARRTYQVKCGDFNTLVDILLSSSLIRHKEATFALLDQRSFECHWQTVRKIAEHSPPPHRKIEIFYFLATGWLDRTISAYNDPEQVMDAWWGNEGWAELRGSSGRKWATRMVQRFIDELNYKSVMAWPIKELEHGQGKTMYYMIHATDHPEAPKLMYRAYNNVMEPFESGEQLSLALGDEPLVL